MFIGVVGKPSVGKSTFFKAATLAEVDIANYPFTTIKPNHAVGFVKVKDVANEFNKNSNPREGYVLENYRFVPVDMMDVAGLVPGAHEGQGMGNQFLDDLRQADVLVHVVDVSGSVNEKGEPVGVGEYDPIKDVKFLEEELDFWYLDILKRGWDKLSRQMQVEKSPKTSLAKQMSGLGVNEDMVDVAIKKLNLTEKKPTEWTQEELLGIATILRKKTKPMIIAANKCDLGEIALNNLTRIKENFKDYIIIPCSAESELALREAAKHELIKYVPGENNFEIIGKLSEKQTQALNFIQKNILDKFNSTGVQDIINNAVFELLGYLAIFPGGVNKLEDSKGNVLPDCFLMPKNSTALDFAYKLHTDFGKNFIKAVNVRTKMPTGKDHPLENLDIIEIMAKK